MGWQRALDVQMDTLQWVQTDIGKKYNFAFFQDVLDKVDEGKHQGPLIDYAAASLAQTYQETLWRADTMYVTTDMLHLLMQAAHDLPADAELEERTLICDRGFCLFEEPIVGIDRREKTIMFHGIAWSKELMRISEHPSEGEKDWGLIIFFLVDPSDPDDDYNKDYLELLYRTKIPTPPLTLQHFYPVRFGEIIKEYVDVVGTKMITETLKIFLAMQLLAQQTIGEPIQLRPDRATRKRFARQWPGHPERIISLITLRRKSMKKDDHEPQKVEWSRRWIVKGHWHKYWYPTRGEHGYKYLHDYVKGPENKPLIPTERRVFNFKR